jgi:hypothetical protein
MESAVDDATARVFSDAEERGGCFGERHNLYRCAQHQRVDGECRNDGAGGFHELHVVVPVLLMRRCGEETVE